ncbi:MAG: Farnesyl diphosphate synthase [Chlamydiae bacterium]|nr:Farnesyl diphosphate synthase [Chlamydiota bacterium]
MQLKNYLKIKSDQIELHLGKLVPEREVPQNLLFQAARYSLTSSGKRLRPILALATTEMLDGDTNIALAPACTLEMIHTYSMIHDDLPCMDDDDFRRGKPTLHKVYPEGHAVLAGDFLHTHAFQILANDPNLSSEQKVDLISILAKSSGGDGMIAGQVMDLEAENKEIDLEKLKWIHQHKTGALIQASIEFGAVLAQASPAHSKALQQFGENIGLAFQIVDDILDVTSSKEKHGKALSSDVSNSKATYVSLLGLENAEATASSLLQTSLDHLDSLPFNTTILSKIAEFIVHRCY